MDGWTAELQINTADYCANGFNAQLQCIINVLLFSEFCDTELSRYRNVIGQSMVVDAFNLRLLKIRMTYRISVTAAQTIYFLVFKL